MLCIKPAVESNGTGVVRIGSQEHLQLLGATLAQRPLLIPGQLFSEDHPPVHMRPGAPPRWFVVEPFVATDSCALPCHISGACLFLAMPAAVVQ